MNTQDFANNPQITSSCIDTIMRKARSDRAEAMRAMLANLPGQLRRLVASVRPNRQRLPQAGAWV